MNIPSYLEMADQSLYNEELSQTLQQGVSDNGFTIPVLTTNQITVQPAIALDGTIGTLATIMPVGTVWFNSDIAKLQVKVALPSTIETITSA